MAWCSIADKQRHSHKVHQRGEVHRTDQGSGREMETPGGKWQELQRNLGNQGGLEAISCVWAWGSGPRLDSPWACKESVTQTSWMPEVARQGLGGCPTTSTQKNRKPSLKCFAGSCQGQLGQRPATEAGLNPGSPGSQSSTQPGGPGGTLALLYKRKPWNLLPWQLLEWWLLQEQTLHMQ